MVLVLLPDSGVTVKTWNVYLIDDGLEENHETFTVTLKNPQNAVLGQRTSASVEIIDPRQGDQIKSMFIKINTEPPDNIKLWFGLREV